MKYLKKYEDVDENYISDIFYSLRAYNLFYKSYKKISNDVRNEILVELELKNSLIINHNMQLELKDSINHFENLTGLNFKFAEIVAKSPTSFSRSLSRWHSLVIPISGFDFKYINLILSDPGIDLYFCIFFTKNY